MTELLLSKINSDMSFYENDVANENVELKKLVIKLSLENEKLRLENSGTKNTNTPNNLQDILFTEFAKSWYEEHRYKWQKTTQCSYMIIINHINSYFSKLNKLLNDILVSDILNYYTYLGNEINLCSNTTRKHHNILRQIFNYSERIEMIEKNPMSKVDAPKINKFVGKAITGEEISNIITQATSSPYKTPIILCAYLGLRRSEALGLTWNNVDFTKGTITISQKCVRIKNNGTYITFVENKLKNESSKRKLALPQQLLDYLKKEQKRQEHNKTIFSEKYRDDYTNFICVNNIGKIITPQALSHGFKRLSIKCGYNDLRLHDLRHSCASILYACDVPLKDIQEWLGHSDYNTTANIYTHVKLNTTIFKLSSILDGQINI